MVITIEYYFELANTESVKTIQIIGNSKYGGGTYLLLKWCAYLVSRGWSVDVLATDPLVIAELKKIKYIRVIQHIIIPRRIAPLNDMVAFCRIVKRLYKEKYSVVHTYTATPSFLGRLAARLTGVPVILHHQAGWTVIDSSSLMHKLFFTPMEYFATYASTRGICVSHAIKKEAARLHIAPLRKLVTICNGIESEPLIVAEKKRMNFRSSINIPETCWVIGTTGRLAPDKDNATLIRAAARLRDILPNIKILVLFAGDGPEQTKLKELTQKLKLIENVRFLGFCHQVPEFLAAIDVFVSVSLREGLSISILEAMAAAKPIVATSIPPNAELIEHEVTGLLTPVRSPDSIAEAISRFFHEPEMAKRCGNEARRRVLADYSLDRMFQETWDLYLAFLYKRHPDRDPVLT